MIYVMMTSYSHALAICCTTNAIWHYNHYIQSTSGIQLSYVILRSRMPLLVECPGTHLQCCEAEELGSHLRSTSGHVGTRIPWQPMAPMASTNHGEELMGAILGVVPLQHPIPNLFRLILSWTSRVNMV